MNFVLAFIFGGLLCALGQIIMDLTKLTPARIMVGYVCVGAALGGIGIYDKFVEIAHAGATVPLMGFGNVLSKGVISTIDEKGVLGIFMGGLSASAAGITAAVIFGFLTAAIFNSKEK